MTKYLDGDVSLVFDNKQALRSGVRYQEFIEKLGQNIVHVHISDNNNSCDCLPIGQGKLDVIDLLTRLNSVSYKGYIMVELYSQMLKNKTDIVESYISMIKFDNLRQANML